MRQGNEAAQASYAEIRQMIKISDGDKFESSRSLEQKLSFQFLEATFFKQQIAITEAKIYSLGLIDIDGMYTNLALLLSDQCPYTLKCAAFGGNDQRNLQNRRNFGGSLLKQLKDCYEFIDLNNRNAASFSGLYRKDNRDFPEQAVREALLNVIVHRDYAYSASTLISIYANWIEFVSIGGLLPGIHMEDVLLGMSICRNKLLADVFYCLKLIEAYGTGLSKILQLYKGQTKQPEIIAGPNSFKLVLPKLQVSYARTSTYAKTPTYAQNQLDKQELSVCELLSKYGEIKRSDVDNALSISQSASSRILKTMQAKGVIEQVGRGKNRRYKLTSK